MRKFLLQFLITATVFAGLWYLFSIISYQRPQKAVEGSMQRLEKTLGKLIIQDILKKYNDLSDHEAGQYIKELKLHLLEQNQITTEINIYLVEERQQINAFAIPGNNIVLLSSMLEFADSPEELTAIIAHEIGHIEGKHIMEKLNREIGMTVLLGFLTGNFSLELLRQVIQTLTSTAYSRQIELEADELAAKYMYHAGLSPNYFINLLYRFETQLDDMPLGLAWLSTHPPSGLRAKNLKQYIQDNDFKLEPSPVFDQNQWEKVLNSLKQ